MKIQSKSYCSTQSGYEKRPRLQFRQRRQHNSRLNSATRAKMAGMVKWCVL